MNEPRDIYAAMVAVQKDLTAVGKNTSSPNLSYEYRSADDVTDMLHPLFVEHGITCVPEVISHDQTDYTSQRGSRMLHVLLLMSFTYYAKDGSSVQVTTIGEGADASDKSCNKAMTQARKAADCQVFTIPTGDVDPEHDRPSLDDKPLPGGDRATAEPRKQDPLEPLNRPLCSEKQRKMLYAVSMSRATALFDECSAHNRPCNHADVDSLAGSIRKQAAIAMNVNREAICRDEITPMKDAIERAVIDNEGDTIIEGEGF